MSLMLALATAAACGDATVIGLDDLGGDTSGRPDGGVDASTGSDTGPNNLSNANNPTNSNNPTNNSDNGTNNSTNNPPGPGGPTRYLAGPLMQPVTSSVVESMAAIRGTSGTPNDDVFMKVGASGTVNAANLTCFGPTSSYRVELDGRDELQLTIDRFNQQTFGAQSSWDRSTDAAEVGRSASWAMAGSPAPIVQEITALNPRFALVNYGTNDMQLGATYASALWPFYDNMVQLLASLTSRGIVPIVTGLNPRGDSADAADWVPTYDAVTRALAESLQLPFVDLYLAVKDLPAQGLISDGIHGNSYSDGGSQPCVFTADGLQFNYNVRNLITLQLLDEVAATLLDGGAPTGQNPRVWTGDGSAATPFEVDVLPFSHHADTTASPNSNIASYPNCDTGQDEGGPEYTYALELDRATPLRIMAFDTAADVDIHLMDGATCLARHDRLIEGTFGPGSYTVVADTFVSSASGPQAGPYTLVILECEPGDARCS